MYAKLSLAKEVPDASWVQIQRDPDALWVENQGVPSPKRSREAETKEGPSNPGRSKKPRRHREVYGLV